MSTIMEKYNLSFVTIITPRRLKCASISSKKDALLNYHLGGYFLDQSIDFLIGDVLPELDKALSGQQFDSDAGGTLSFLTVGQSTSSFSAIDESKPDISIPTQDIKDIITAWTQWVIVNNLQNNVS